MSVICEKWGKMLKTFAVCLTVFLMNTITVAAAVEMESNDTVSSADYVSVGSVMQGSLSSGRDVDYYKFSVGSAGYFNINFNHEYVDSGSSYWCLKIYNNSQHELYKRYIHGNETVNSTAFTGIPAGTYYIRIESCNWSNAPYKFKVNFKASEKWETETNNSFNESDAVSVNNTVNGTIIESNDNDYFKFYVPANGAISLKFNHDYVDSGSSYWKVRLYNEANQILYTRWFNGNKTQNTVENLGVSAGTYFLRIESALWSDAKYNFMISYSKSNQWEKEFNDTFNTANAIGLNTRTYGNLREDNDKDYFRFTMSKAGQVNLNFRHQYIDSGSSYWKIGLYDSVNQKITETYIKGNITDSTLNKIALKAGTYYIRIESSRYFEVAYNFSINKVTAAAPKKVNSIKLNKKSVDMYMGNAVKKAKHIQLRATVAPSNAANKKVKWKSSNTKVVSVSSNGVLKPKGVGTATITCTAADGSGKKATCKVKVGPGRAKFSSVKTSGSKVEFKIREQKTVSGYQVYIGKYKNGTYKKYKTLNNSKRTFTCSKSFYKKYWFVVRAYRTIGKKKYYGEFSTPK